MGSIAFISFIVLMLIGMSSANPVIGKKSNRYRCRYLNNILDINQHCNTINISFLFGILDSAGDFEMVNLCLRNCAQCKKMYGSYFEGQMCADGCIKFKGKVIPGIRQNMQHSKSGYNLICVIVFEIIVTFTYFMLFFRL